jgi:hypothetical protein
MQGKAVKLNDLKKITRFNADNFMQTLPVTRSELFSGRGAAPPFGREIAFA